MTTHITHPSVHLTPKTTVIGGGAALILAVTAGLVVGALDGEPAPPATPDSGVSQSVPDTGVRDSWEGRIGPTSNGVRDSWMPPGATDRDLEGLERLP